MSNSTPQTQSTVSSEAFEALIDLLASDGIEDNSAIPETRTRAQPNATLRDSSGNLDFDKIRSMFAAQRETQGTTCTAAAPKPFPEDGVRMELTALPTESRRSEDGGGDVEAHPQRSTSPLAIAPSRSNSRSPQRANCRNTAHHRILTFGDHLWSGIPANWMGSKVRTYCSTAPTSLQTPPKALTT
ncbi:hypothetical protein PAXRUDRAFT_829034 [Paxillus rubicundulus Ve08.2h10]|uniref:Uncharacterized protein n=1 Tax=Paxillus rubicundulus Ve08.2h10 TaxID=930991 RepID=A0A0D0E0K6_9AGAM|nr:hypothetical protein PAXRUDRAFT_829034 [Paxillus rubicundulus Ve08.2h10]